MTLKKNYQIFGLFSRNIFHYFVRAEPRLLREKNLYSSSDIRQIKSAEPCEQPR